MISLLMATLNRAGTLAEVLESYCQLAPPPNGWEIVIVDNGSSDKTCEVVRSYETRLPLLYLLETTKGKTNALNTGMKRIRGDLVLFVDDDAIPNRSWLRSYSTAEKEHAEYDVFGGPVVCRWPANDVDWLSTDEEIVHTCFGATGTGLVSGEVSGLVLSGANFAVRRRVLPPFPVFNPRIGPNGSRYAMGSEADLLKRLEESGVKTWFLQDAIVQHIIRLEQLSRNWLLQRAMNSGRGIYAMWPETDGRKVLGVPRSILGKVFSEALAWFATELKRDRVSAFSKRWRFYRSLGYARRSISIARCP